jgi:hypothetical protein
MNTCHLIAVVVLTASACLPEEGTCEGGGVRAEGLCECPAGHEEDNKCVTDAPDGGKASPSRGDDLSHRAQDVATQSSAKEVPKDVRGPTPEE